jgi:hypothetical protein
MNKLNPNPSDDICIVTAFLDIGRESWNNKYKRTTNFYIESFLNYLEYPYKMVCYIDDKYIDKILEEYIKSPYNNKLFIPINKKWLECNINAWKNLNKEKEIMESDEYKEMLNKRKEVLKIGTTIAKFPENEIPEYNAINHSKIDFIINAIENGYINDSITCWCDFGYFGTQHDNKKESFPKSTLEKNYFLPNKIMFFINDVRKYEYDPYKLLIYALDIFMGTFWGGPTELMYKLQELYHKSVDELYNLNISDDDQHIYLRCFIKESSLFDIKIVSKNELAKCLLYLQKI